MRQRIAAAWIGLVTTATAVAQAGFAGPFESELPTREQRSSWSQEIPRDARAGSGAVPIGNGRVFAVAGIGARANSLTGFVGPTYAGRRSAHPITLEVEIDGRELPLPERRVERTQHACYVVTEDRGPEFVLRTATFAPADGAELLRLIELERHTGTGPFRGRLRCTDHDLEIAFDGSDRGMAWSGALSIGGGDPVSVRTRETAEAVELAKATLAAWRQRSQATPRYDSDRADLRDLFGDWRVNLSVMRCAETGLVLPMASASRIHVRDASGVVLGLLRCGMHAEARAVLEHVERTTRALGEVPTVLRPDFDLDGVEDRETNWPTVAVPPGATPSWIILQHYWYWRATRDTELVDRHWPLIDLCLKRQDRDERDLVGFAGDEPWLPRDFAARDGRSFVASMLSMLATQAVGELLAARLRMHYPERYTDEDPSAAEDNAYRRRMFTMLQNVEAAFWLEDESRFAPAIDTDGTPVEATIAHAGLLPLWAGWTYPTGEKSRDNLRNTLARVHLDGVRIGSTDSDAAARGDLAGMLLVALSERDGARRLDVLDDLVARAAPAGAWSAAITRGGDAAGDPLHPGVGGLNLDAIAHALTGIRHAAVPGWDKHDIRLELRLPLGADRFSVLGHAKDGRVLDVSFRRQMHLMSADEIEANAELEPEKRRDPSVEHPQIAVTIELVAGEPKQGYYDVGMHAGSTLFVRFLKLGDAELGRIVETDYITEDDSVFLPR